MIYQVEGDILLSKAQVLVHGVSVNDPMDKGLALALHQRYPAMHKDYHHWCHQHHPKSGDAWFWGGVDGVRIVSLITREGIDSHDHRLGKASVSNVSHCLKALVKMIETEKFSSIALPKLGTGLGGLDWQEVWPIIERSLGDLDIPVYVYSVYHSGKQAVESGA